MFLPSLALLALVLAFTCQADMQQLMGISNCPNKCNKVFDRTQYAISDQPGADTFEFRSCIIGCNQCSSVLSKLPSEGTSQSDNTNSNDNCFQFCKTFNYGGRGIRKGLIEPDKACIMGCIINTCQQICTGGTTDNQVTPANQNLWWGLGGNGCSIKGHQGYVQNPQYGNPNQPGGQGATDQKQCCTNALNLCSYNGDKSSINYHNVVLVAKRSCAPFVKEGNNATEAICNFFGVPRNCGTQGMGSQNNLTPPPGSG